MFQYSCYRHTPHCSTQSNSTPLYLRAFCLNWASVLISTNVELVELESNKEVPPADATLSTILRNKHLSKAPNFHQYLSCHRVFWPDKIWSEEHRRPTGQIRIDQRIDSGQVSLIGCRYANFLIFWLLIHITAPYLCDTHFLWQTLRPVCESHLVPNSIPTRNLTKKNGIWKYSKASSAVLKKPVISLFVRSLLSSFRLHSTTFLSIFVFSLSKNTFLSWSRFPLAKSLF